MGAQKTNAESSHATGTRKLEDPTAGSTALEVNP